MCVYNLTCNGRCRPHYWGGGVDVLRDLVDIVPGGQPGTDVQELDDSRPLWRGILSEYYQCVHHGRLSTPAVSLFKKFILR